MTQDAPGEAANRLKIKKQLTPLDPKQTASTTVCLVPAILPPGAPGKSKFVKPLLKQITTVLYILKDITFTFQI